MRAPCCGPTARLSRLWQRKVSWPSVRRRWNRPRSSRWAPAMRPRRRYRAGLADIITVLASQRTAFDSESQLLNIRRLRLDNRVDLHLALGGGFETSKALPDVSQQQPFEQKTNSGKEAQGS